MPKPGVTLSCLIDVMRTKLVQKVTDQSTGTHRGEG